MSSIDLLHPKVKETLLKLGVRSLTEVQEKAIPIVLRGFNTLIMASTGSGKTEASLLPVASLMLEAGDYGKLTTLYITPLRSLNRDIALRAFKLFKYLGMNVDVWHGDTSYSRRRKITETPPEVLVTTPESFNVILVNKKMRKFLRDVKYVIIDEIHELIESKRGTELVVGLERLASLARFQRIGLSATISEVTKAKHFLGGGRYVVEVSSSMKKNYRVDFIVGDGFNDMLRRIREILEKTDGMLLIFTNTRDTAEVVGGFLKKYYSDLVYVHHGSLSKDEREAVEEKARRGELKAIVATSSLELGIDIGHVKYVIQVASPRRVARLIQRIGRAKHNPTERPEGAVVTGLKPYEVLESLVIARRAIARDLEKIEMHENAADVLAHQIVGILMEEERRVDDVYRIVTRAYPYWKLSFREFEEVFNLLISNKMIKCDNSICKATKKGEIYYRTTSMIVESKRIPVREYGKGAIGSLDEEFVAELEYGDRFILAGRIWKVLGIDEEAVIVEKDEGEGPPPAWEGELIPVSFEVAREVGALKRAFDRLIANYPISDETLEKLRDIINSINEPKATDRNIIVEIEGNMLVVNVHGGSKVNNAFGYALCYLLRQIYGSCSFNTTPYHVIVFVGRNVNENEIHRIILLMKKINLEKVIVDELKRSRIYRWRMIKVLTRMGLINRKKLRSDELKKIEKTLPSVYNETVVAKETIREILLEKLDIDKLKIIVNKTDVNNIIVKRGLTSQSLWALETNSYVKESSLENKDLIENLVRKRLENREVKMICMLCGHEWSGKVGDISLKCPKCGSGFVVPSFNEENIEKAARSIVSNKKISKELKKASQEARERAQLLTTYGRDALVVLAGRGIASTTAKRILQEYKLRGNSLIKEIIKAEKKYIATRRFWR